MIRVLMVLDISLDENGPSVHLLKDIIQSLCNRGDLVDVIQKRMTNVDGAPNVRKVNDNLTYYYVDCEAEKKTSFAKRYIDEIVYAKRVSMVCSTNRYDSIFLLSYSVAIFYLLFLKKYKCPIVFNVQDIFPYNLHYSKQLPLDAITFPVFRYLQHLAYKKCNCLITISDDMKRTLILDGINENKIHVVYNWSYSDDVIREETINEEDFYPLGLERDKYNIIYAGNIGKMQNVEYIVKAASQCRESDNFMFYIIGNGVNKERVIEMSNGLKNIRFLPMQPAKYAESIYAQADVNVITLAVGGIKTALPSKTATCLRVQKPIVFCIDKNSLFETKFSKDSYVVFCKNNDPTSLLNKLRELKDSNGEINRDSLGFISRDNSNMYARLIERASK